MGKLLNAVNAWGDRLREKDPIYRAIDDWFQTTSLSRTTATIYNALETTVANKFIETSTYGSQGSMAQYSINPYIIIYYRKIADDNTADWGRPCLKEVRIANAPGFIKCSEAHLPISGLKAEQELLEQMMVGGFFYE